MIKGLSEQVPGQPRSHKCKFQSCDREVLGHVDYPDYLPPYPVALILHHRCAGQIEAYTAHAGWALAAGYAAFRFDRLTEGQSTTIAKADALNAYRVALSQPNIDASRPVIIAQSVGTRVLASIFHQLAAIQQPMGCILLSNILSGRDLLKIKSPILIVLGEHDIFGSIELLGPQAAAQHKAAHHLDCDCYIASNADHCLVFPPTLPTYWHDPGFMAAAPYHQGAVKTMIAWLTRLLDGAGNTWLSDE